MNFLILLSLSKIKDFLNKFYIKNFLLYCSFLFLKRFELETGQGKSYKKRKDISKNLDSEHRDFYAKSRLDLVSSLNDYSVKNI